MRLRDRLPNYIETSATLSAMNTYDYIIYKSGGNTKAFNGVTGVGSVANELVAVTALDATHITVAIKKRSDGSAGTNQVIYWHAWSPGGRKA